VQSKEYFNLNEDMKSNSMISSFKFVKGGDYSV